MLLGLQQCVRLVALTARCCFMGSKFGHSLTSTRWSAQARTLQPPARRTAHAAMLPPFQQPIWEGRTAAIGG